MVDINQINQSFAGVLKQQKFLTENMIKLSAQQQFLNEKLMKDEISLNGVAAVAPVPAFRVFDKSKERLIDYIEQLEQYFLQTVYAVTKKRNRVFSRGY